MRDRPRWFDTMRPDEVTAARLRRAILAAAQPLLAARRDSWWDVASNWATLLTPVAAVLTLLFAGLAIRQGLPGDESTASSTESSFVVDHLRSEVVPAGFTSERTDDPDNVFAALGEADARASDVERYLNGELETSPGER